MTNLADTLKRSREMIEDALTEARTELDALRARQAELEEQIAQAEAALTDPSAPPERAARMTLHKALAHVLREHNNDPMTARELADAVNQQGLYHKKDGSPVEANQVHARTNNYRDVFEKDGPNIRLKEESTKLATTPESVSIFRDDDEGFLTWLDDNPDGYFINSYPDPSPEYLVLHRPGCRHFKGGGAVRWTSYAKLCSPDRDELEDWALDTVGGEVTLCRSCFS
jgi:hypothetical protein